MNDPLRPGVPGTLTGGSSGSSLRAGPTSGRHLSRSLLTLFLLFLLALSSAACGDSDPPTVGAPGDSSTTSAGSKSSVPLKIGAIPDQDPEKLQRLYSTVAGYLEKELGVPVEYVPVTDYTAAVTLFKVGDLDLVWFGGLSGVQARLQVDGAEAIVQRDIDAAFHSLFIANPASGIKAVMNAEGLGQLKGRRFTFGSESSTSGRLMPEFFLGKAGVKITDFQGPPGFSGSHDKTIDLVAAGTYEAGVVNEQVWKDRVAKGTVDLSKVDTIYRTPAYHDYHWVVHPQVKKRYGPDMAERIQKAFERLDATDPTARTVLELFGARKFIPTDNSQYRQIEEVGRSTGLIL
ncbi:MAG TPA: putative selenate ABC transporter substrate-binding protein [Acidimicrobiales bacterium]|nr:putative selenate ABC transporter substrate-binding protein [Acidimicrobiales bacterium]